MDFSPQFWFLLICFLVLFGFFLNQWLDWLNTRSWKDEIPVEMKDYYSSEAYLKARRYKKENNRLSLSSSAFSIGILTTFLGMGFFGKLDMAIAVYNLPPFLHAALFFLILYIGMDLLGLPFALYATFNIEEKYGFNRTTVKTFVLDKIKGYLLTVALGGSLLWLAMLIIDYFQEGFWLWLWITISVILILMNMFYADLFLPLFNKLTPLEEGELRDGIEAYAKKVGYSLKNIYVIDGSKRSSKGNAFFSGMGPRKTIALYDTLIEKHEKDELVAILAHEVGHYKKNHIPVSMLLSVLQIGLMLFLFEQFIRIDNVALALGAESASFHIGIIGFGIVFSPLSTIIGIGMNMMSRKNEYEADAYAAETFSAEPLITGLKKLSADNLSNMYPHPYYVFVHYSHPPLLQRIKALRSDR